MALEIKLVRGLAGTRKTQIEVLKSLGLHKTNDVTTQPDNAATRGKIAKVSHLVEVTER
ncbi:MAG: 50S ribosomal protein L30 [Bacillota bacterium]|jgi:large subunit ribosomal protein L30